MEKRKDNEGEIEKEEEANNSLVLFSALRKDIADVLDFLERLKNEENQKALDVDQVEKLKSELAFICIYVQLYYSNLEQFEDVMTAKRQEVEDLLQSILNDVDNNVGCKYNMHHVLASLRDNIDHCISSHHRSKSSATMPEEQLNLAEVGCFIKQILETSPDILREYLIHLQEHMVTDVTPSTLGARNIHVMIEFLLIILTDLPKDFIHHDKLFDLLERVTALTRCKDYNFSCCSWDMAGIPWN